MGIYEFNNTFDRYWINGKKIFLTLLQMISFMILQIIFIQIIYISGRSRLLYVYKSPFIPHQIYSTLILLIISFKIRCSCDFPGSYWSMIFIAYFWEKQGNFNVATSIILLSIVEYLVPDSIMINLFPNVL